MSEYIQNGNSITVPKGALVCYTVSLNGYPTVSGTVVADETKTVTIELQELDYRILTINTPQENAVIEFEVVNEDGIYTYTNEETMSYYAE